MLLGAFLVGLKPMVSYMVTTHDFNRLESNATWPPYNSNQDKCIKIMTETLISNRNKMASMVRIYYLFSQLQSESIPSNAGERIHGGQFFSWNWKSVDAIVFFLKWTWIFDDFGSLSLCWNLIESKTEKWRFSIFLHSSGKWIKKKLHNSLINIAM